MGRKDRIGKFNHKDVSKELAKAQSLPSAHRKMPEVGLKLLKPKTINQSHYMKAVEESTVVFGIGPAGTGKTTLAVNFAISEVLKKNFARIIIARPIVEAGENLGFLPGDMNEKVDPYIKPVTDAIKDIVGDKKSREFISSYMEISPLAYMRGRTFNDSIMILDEAQNATEEQMFMFLTRLGNNSKLIVTADPTQIDLKKKRDSGIFEAIAALKNSDGVRIIQLTHTDIVRCPMVSVIVTAYMTHRNKHYEEHKILQEVVQI